MWLTYLQNTYLLTYLQNTLQSCQVFSYVPNISHIKQAKTQTSFIQEIPGQQLYCWYCWVFVHKDSEWDASALSFFSDLGGDQGAKLKLVEIKKSSQISRRLLVFVGHQLLQPLLPSRNCVQLITVILPVLLNMSQYCQTLLGEQLGFFFYIKACPF